MSKFQIGDTVDTGRWGIVTVNKVYKDYPEYFGGEYFRIDGAKTHRNQGMFKNNESKLVAPAYKVEEAPQVLDNPWHVVNTPEVYLHKEVVTAWETIGMEYEIRIRVKEEK